MKLSNQEISTLSKYTDVYRNDCERSIRRIRRNKDYLIARYENLGQEFCDDSGIAHPDIEINMLKEKKTEAVILKKKLQLMKREVK